MTVNGSGKHKISSLDLYECCKSLESEICEFRLDMCTKTKKIEISTFHNNVKSEVGYLEKAVSNHNDNNSNNNVKYSGISSSNYPFYKAVWTEAKLIPDVIALTKTFYYEVERKPSRKADHVKVDIVGNNGFLWVKLSTGTTKRSLEFETADMIVDSDDEGDNQYPFDEFSIVKTAKRLLRAAEKIKIQHIQPQIILIIPNLERGESVFIDGILDYITSLGVELYLGQNRTVDKRIVSVELDRGFPGSQTLNFDVTTLIALVSDISNTIFQGPLDCSLHSALRAQIQGEQQTPILKDNLFHCIGSGRQLTCPTSAFEKFMEILDALGSEKEKARGKVLFSPLITNPVEEFQKLTVHKVAQDMILPIKVLKVPDFDASVIPSELELMIRGYDTRLSEVARDVVLAGWINNWTTITANSQVSKILGRELPRRDPSSLFLAVHIHHGRSLLRHLGEWL
ncbi:UPF0415 protein [Neolecta irregularis DAH-3]|uniref:UPF0415 protein n=1 Tax=Neolecta irregularis (strain DAH-3) TaxID=1198029 RepID=A0A1U7LRH7_NEOID|nr:UPF0415 protein [Neolecta irregularis DAH-3]|eukprot:OLL25152.1 UPF0415 protein [Neolecta irregularis DAH-3]